MNFSFKDFATQFAKFTTFPISAVAVASSQGFNNRPISLRQVMSEGAPYVPDLSIFGFFDNTNNPGQVAFFWADDAQLPPWDNLSWSPNPARAATGWEFQLWETSGGGKAGAQVFDVTLSLHALQVNGRVQNDYTGTLDGNYLFKVTAFNNYGSATTGTSQITIGLAAPSLNITVTTLGSNNFEVQGTGFTDSNPVQVNVSSSVSNNSASKNTTAGANGSIKVPINCQSVCSAAGGGQLQFQATDSVTGAKSNTVLKNCS